MANFGLIVGSGVLDWDIDWQELPGVDTDYGAASAPLLGADIGGHRVFALPRHGLPHRFAPHAVNYRANLKLLEAQAVCAIVALNTVGGITPSAITGELLVPDQIIDYTWGRVQSFSADDAVRHIDFSEPYDAHLRSELLRAGLVAGCPLANGGVMGVTQGPRLETAAEITRMSRDGCAIVGMTGMPEAVLARELGIPFASLSLVVNPAAGLAADVIDLEDIYAAARRCMESVTRLLGVFFETVEGFD